MLTVVVKKDKWLRGETSSHSRLYRPVDKKMCCIGFLARELGCAVSDISGMSVLSQVVLPETSTFVNKYDSILQDAYEVNDDPDLTDSQRTTKLKEIGKEMGVNFQFV